MDNIEMEYKDDLGEYKFNNEDIFNKIVELCKKDEKGKLNSRILMNWIVLRLLPYRRGQYRNIFSNYQVMLCNTSEGLLVEYEDNIIENINISDVPIWDRDTEYEMELYKKYKNDYKYDLFIGTNIVDSY